MMKQIKEDVLFNTVRFNSVYVFAQFFNSLETADGVHIIPNIIAKYDEMEEIINVLVKEYDYNIYSASFAPEYVNGYKAEYILSVDDGNNIWVEPMLIDTGYLNPADSSFIHNSCNSKIITSYDRYLFIPFEMSLNS